MAVPVTAGTLCMCSFGIAPSPVIATGVQTLGVNMPMATIMDKPMAPFGMCSSLANPAVASATAAALGVLTPQPCTPMLVGPWFPGSPTVLINNKPALNNSSKLMCAFAGVISVISASAVTVQIP